MRVLHVIAEINPIMGGVGQAIRTIIAGLEPLGILNEVVSLDDPNSPFLAEEQIHITALGPRRNAWGYTDKLKPWLKKNLPRFKAVILHGLWLYPGYATFSAIKELNKHKSSPHLPFFIMPHGMLDPYFQQASERKLKALRNKIYWKLIESKIVNNSTALLFTCEEERILARLPFIPYKPKSEKIVGLGAEKPPQFNSNMEASFKNRCDGLKNSRYLLFLSRIHEKKGVDILIAAYKKFLSSKNFYYKENERNNNNDAKHTYPITDSFSIPKLVIAGPGLKSTYGQKLQQMVLEDEELKSNVLFTGMLQGDAKWGAFYGCDAFILPSHQENFGIAVVEAMAAKKPVLISNKVNIWREIVFTGGGFVNDDTIEGTFNSIQEWQNLTEADKKNLGLKARATFEQNFTTEIVAKRFFEILKKTELASYA